MDHSATAHQIEETEVTPVKGAGQTVVINQAEPAANEDAYERPREIDLFNEGGSGETTFDQKSKKAFLEWAVPGEWNIGGNGGGALYQVSKAEKAQERDERELDFIAEMFERAEHAKKWDESLHTIGNQQFTGHELMSMKKWLEDAQHQEEYEKDLMEKYGISKEEARKRRLQMQEILDLYEKERLGKLTPEERKRLEELNKKPEIAQDANILQAVKEKYAFDNKASTLGSNNEQVSAYQDAMRDDKAVSSLENSSLMASENLVSGVRLSPTYNAHASGQITLATNEPKYATQAAARPLENTVQISGPVV